MSDRDDALPGVGMFAFYNRLNVHVLASNRTVIAAVHRRFKLSARYSRELRASRHECYRRVLECHHDAQQLYKEMRF